VSPGGRAPVLTCLGCLAFALWLPACSERSRESTVDFWAMGREGEVVRELLPDFEVRHPGLRVRLQQIPWSAAHEKLLTAYAGGAMPDVFHVGSTWIPEFAALGALAPLDERIARSTSVDSQDFFAGILEASRIDGVTLAVPWYVDTRLLFYREDLLERAGVKAPPRQWNEWLAVLERLRSAGASEFRPILLPLREWEPLVILALQRGAPLLREDATRGDFREPRFADAFRWYVALFQRGLAPVVDQTGNLYLDFAQGRFAMLITGPWNLGEFARRLPPTLQTAWATAPLPAPSGDGPGLSLAGGASLALSRSAAPEEAAWQLVEFLSEPAQQVRLHRLSGDLPARRTAWQDAGLLEEPRASAFWTQLAAVVSPPRIPEWERIAQRIARAGEAAVRGEESIDEALASLDADVDRLLEKRRWLREHGAGASP